MEVADKTLAFDRGLWVQYGGVDVAEDGARIVVTGRDEDSYLKVFNHFGRVLKLYTFEAGRWVDADTGMAPQPLDEAQAGHLPATGAPPKPPARAGKTGAKAAPAKAQAKRTTAKRTTAKAPAKGGGKSAAKGAAGKPGTAKRTAGTQGGAKGGAGRAKAR